MGEEKLRIPALNGTNFVIWKNRMSLYLEVVEGNPSANFSETQNLIWISCDKKAKYIIASVVPDCYYAIIDGKQTAKQMMEALTNHFTVKSVTQQTHVKREIMRLQHVKGQSLANHFLQFDELIRKLEAAGAKVEEEDKLSYLFLSLSQEYDPVTSALENMEKLSLDVAKSRLLEEKVKLNSLCERECKSSGSFSCSWTS